MVQSHKWLEQEFAKDGIKIEWNFFRGAGPAIAEGLAAKQLDVVFLGDLASVIGRARGLPTKYIFASGRGTNSFLATAPGVDIKTVADLKGKNVSVPFGSAAHGMLLQVLGGLAVGEEGRGGEQWEAAMDAAVDAACAAAASTAASARADSTWTSARSAAMAAATAAGPTSGTPRPSR